MALMITENDLRSVLSLPNKPYADPFVYVGDPYYDLTRAFATGVMSCSGTVSATPHLFSNGVDFSVHDGVTDWTVGSLRPDLGTMFTVAYNYSRLGSGTVSTSMFMAEQMVTLELGPSFPYGTIGSGSVDKGFDYNKLAKMMQLICAARESCKSLSSGEIDLASKIRRGSVVIDDTKKTSDWIADAQMWDAKYKQYLNLVKPRGGIHVFTLTNRDAMQMVMADWGSFQSMSGESRAMLLDSYLTGDLY